jgi:hypothetical protein
MSSGFDSQTDGALEESLANTMLLLNSWASLDLDRQAGKITDEVQRETFSTLVAMMGTEFFLTLEMFPDLKANVMTAYKNAQDVLRSMVTDNYL